MFNLFKKSQEDSELRGEENHEEAVILEILLESGEELGSRTEHNSIYTLEESITSVIDEDETMDGHDFGEGMATLYLYGPSADKLFENIKDILRKSDFTRFEVTLRYGAPEDPDSKEKHFTLS